MEIVGEGGATWRYVVGEGGAGWFTGYYLHSITPGGNIEWGGHIFTCFRLKQTHYLHLIACNINIGEAVLAFTSTF